MGCVYPAVIEVHLNTSAPSEPDALFLSITTSLLSTYIVFKALVDSGSTHCFVNSRFISTYNPFQAKLNNTSVYCLNNKVHPGMMAVKGEKKGTK